MLGCKSKAVSTGKQIWLTDVSTTKHWLTHRNVGVQTGADKIDKKTLISERWSDWKRKPVSTGHRVTHRCSDKQTLTTAYWNAGLRKRNRKRILDYWTMLSSSKGTCFNGHRVNLQMLRQTNTDYGVLKCWSPNWCERNRKRILDYWRILGSRKWSTFNR